MIGLLPGVLLPSISLHSHLCSYLLSHRGPVRPNHQPPVLPVSSLALSFFPALATPPEYCMSLSYTVCLWEENAGPSRVAALLNAASQAHKQSLAMVGTQQGLAH